MIKSDYKLNQIERECLLLLYECNAFMTIAQVRKYHPQATIPDRDVFDAVENLCEHRLAFGLGRDQYRISRTGMTHAREIMRLSGKNEYEFDVYLASSWRNDFHPAVLKHLRAHLLRVYDFRHPNDDDNGFHWSEIDPQWQQWDLDEYIEALEHPIADRGYHLDYNAMRKSACCVLLLPSGSSSHLEAGYFWGAGRPLIICSTQRIGLEPELMYRCAELITNDVDEIATYIRDNLIVCTS